MTEPQVDSDRMEPQEIGRVAVPYVVIAAIACAGTALVLIGTSRYGVGLSPDSASYLAAARSLASGEGYRTFASGPYLRWPPLFPTILAGLELVGIEPPTGARLLNALAFGLIILCAGHLLRRTVQTRLLAVLGTASVASSALLQVSMMAWSEPLFVLLVLLSLVELSTFLETNQSRALIRAALLAALCLLQRYAGAMVILSGCLMLVLYGPRGSFRKRIAHSAFFGCLSAAPAALWMVHHHIVTGAAARAGVGAQAALSHNAVLVLRTLGKWFLADGARLPMGIVVLGVAAAAAMALWRRSDQATASVAPRTIRAGTMGAFALAFVAQQVVLSTILPLDRIGDRLLIPVHVPLMLLVFMELDGVLDWLRQADGKRRAARAAIVALLGVGVLCSVGASLAKVPKAVRRGAGGYATAPWQESPAMHWLRQNPLKGQVYSNSADAIYLLTGLQAVYSPSRQEDLARIRECLAAGNAAYLLWFKGARRGWQWDLPRLASVLDLQEIQRFDAATLYIIRRVVAPATPVGSADRADYGPHQEPSESCADSAVGSSGTAWHDSAVGASDCITHGTRLVCLTGARNHVESVRTVRVFTDTLPFQRYASSQDGNGEAFLHRLPATLGPDSPRPQLPDFPANGGLDGAAHPRSGKADHGRRRCPSSSNAGRLGERCMPHSVLRGVESCAATCPAAGGLRGRPAREESNRNAGKLDTSIALRDGRAKLRWVNAHYKPEASSVRSGRR